MDGPHAVYPFPNTVSDESGFGLNLHNLSCESYCTKDEQCTFTNMTDNVVNKMKQASYCCSAINKVNAIDKKVGVDETFRLQISYEQLTLHDPTSEEDKLSNCEDISICKEFISPDTRLKKCLIKSATFPSSEVECLNFYHPEMNGASSSTSATDQNPYAGQLPTYKRSTSLSASSKIVSAMKGGRAQIETSPRMDMRVKWAEDVYDPPSTSVSHTVKSYNIQRPKSKKKDNHRQKHKGKNYRGNNSGKKFQNRRNVGCLSAHFPAKLQAGGANGSSVQSEDILEFAVGGVHDVKCGSIYLRESLAKVHLSFGEAT